MDNDYIIEHLHGFCTVMYGRDVEIFAKYSRQRKLFIFGCIHPFGQIIKNVVDKSVAIYLIVGISGIKNHKT